MRTKLIHGNGWFKYLRPDADSSNDDADHGGRPGLVSENGTSFREYDITSPNQLERMGLGHNLHEGLDVEALPPRARA